MAGCSKITESPKEVQLKELEIQKFEDSLRWHGRIKKLELEAEIKKENIKKGKEESPSLNFGY
jgi:hypothetical protein